MSALSPHLTQFATILKPVVVGDAERNTPFQPPLIDVEETLAIAPAIYFFSFFSASLITAVSRIDSLSATV
jgi:hypothetical protein